MPGSVYNHLCLKGVWRVEDGGLRGLDLDEGLAECGWVENQDFMF